MRVALAAAAALKGAGVVKDGAPARAAPKLPSEG
jgi:hypothetical protein